MHFSSFNSHSSLGSALAGFGIFCQRVKYWYYQFLTNGKYVLRLGWTPGSHSASSSVK